MVKEDTFESIINFDEPHPFGVLGPHESEQDGVLVSVFLPDAKEAWIKQGRKKKVSMQKINDEGIFQLSIAGHQLSTGEKIRYKIHYSTKNDEYIIKDDPYNFPPLITDLDLHLIGEGKHFKSYEKLGAKICRINGIRGIHFAVWAPNAKSVSVTGEFNDWKAGVHPMENLDDSGIWCLVIPGIGEGTVYKYAIKSKSDNEVRFKSDPYAFQSELRPDNASVAASLKKYRWNDKEWMKEKKKSKQNFKHLPVSIYEVHLGSWKKDHANNEWGYKNYRELAHELVKYVMETGYTHIELLPVMEHPLDISWGYQVVNFFAPTSRYGSQGDFMYFVDHCHRNGIGVILDWVPAHFPSDAHGLADFDGKQIYAYENPKKGYHKDWGTFVFDYGKNEVKNFLISNALFWFEKYHVDGLRVDAVASMLYLDYSRNEGEWEPNVYGGRENLEAINFIKDLNKVVHDSHKGILMIAEESTSWPGVCLPVHLGGLGFDMKWNMGWMHDTLAYFSMDPIHRKFHHGKLTFSLWYAFSENFILPVSHDEVVHLKRSLIEKMPGNEWQKFANLRLFFGYMFAHPGKKLNFMGNDIAQFGEWNSEAELDWNVLDNDLNKKLHRYFKDLSRLYKEKTAFHEVDFESRGFQWLDFSDADNSVIAFARYNKDKSRMLMFTFNFTPVARENYAIGVPEPGYYREILNSDAEEYGGSGKGNLGGVQSEPVQRFEWENSVMVSLPPLGMNVYEFENKIALVTEEKLSEEEKYPVYEG